MKYIRTTVSLPKHVLLLGQERAKRFRLSFSEYIARLIDEDARLQRETITIVAEESPEYQKLAIVITDPIGRITYVNSSFTKMCGYSLEQLRGRKPGDLLQGPRTEQNIVREFRKAIRARQPFECTLTNYRADRSTYQVHIKMHPVFDNTGNLVQFKALEETIA